MENEYRGLLRDVLKNGSNKQDRTGTGTRSVFGRMLKHDMSNGFPLLTGKKIQFNHAITELLWILQGRTDLQYLHDHGLHYWDPDYARSGRTDGTLGPIYGKQLREHNGVDQLKNVLKLIKEEPCSRRIVASLWNPSDMPDMALPPCHYGFQVNITDGKLDLYWSQRSADLFLGLPYDFAMYGLLLVMLSKGAGLQPGELTCFLGDCHIYNNHFDAVDKYLAAPTYDLPWVSVEHGLKLVRGAGDFILIPTHNMIHLGHYDHGPAIKAPLSVGT